MDRAKLAYEAFYAARNQRAELRDDHAAWQAVADALDAANEDKARLLASLADIVEFCDDPDGSEKGESLACGLVRLLPAARVAVKAARKGE